MVLLFMSSGLFIACSADGPRNGYIIDIVGLRKV